MLIYGKAHIYNIIYIYIYFFYVYAYMYAYTCTYLFYFVMYICVYMHVYMYIYIYIYIYLPKRRLSIDVPLLLFSPMHLEEFGPLGPVADLSVAELSA